MYLRTEDCGFESLRGCEGVFVIKHILVLCCTYINFIVIDEKYWPSSGPRSVALNPEELVVIGLEAPKSQSDCSKIGGEIF
jgi:hypothetical protein